MNQDIPSPAKDVLQEKLIDPDPDPNLSDVEEVELAGEYISGSYCQKYISDAEGVFIADYYNINIVYLILMSYEMLFDLIQYHVYFCPPESVKKTESRVNDMLEELLSYNDDDLEGQGALNILQDRLKIKTLDKENLRGLTELHDVERTNIFTSPGSGQRPRRSSVVFNSVLENLNKKPRSEHELVENPANRVSSPTPPRNPFGSISLLKKKILQPNHLNDPFSPQDIDLCPHPNSSRADPKDKLLGQVDISKDLGHELESHVKFGRTESAMSYMDSQQVMQNADNLPEQSRSENASMQKESGSTRENASPAQLGDKLVGQADVPKELGMFCEMEVNVEFNSTNPPFCELDTHEVNENADGLPEQFEDENARIPGMDANSRRNEEPNNDIGEAMNTNGSKNSVSMIFFILYLIQVMRIFSYIGYGMLQAIFGLLL